MATVMELIGLSPMGTAAVPQVDPRKDDVALRCGQIIMDAVRNNLRARDICTRAGLRKRHRRRGRHGGSTNAVLHLLAMAREAEVPLSIDDFDAVWRAPRSSWTSNRAAASWPRTWIRPAASA